MQDIPRLVRASRACSLLLLLDRWAHASVLDWSVLLRLLPKAVRVRENLALFTPLLLLPPVHPPLGLHRTGGLHRTRVEGGTHGRREVMDGVAMTLAILPDVSSCVACGRSAGFTISRETSFSGIKLGAGIKQKWSLCPVAKRVIGH